METPPEKNDKPSTPDPSFIEKVRECLDHIYDLPFLNSNALFVPKSTAQLAGKSLRVELMRMIENLNPGPHFALTSREARAYNLLRLRYLQRMGVEEIANLLSISARQTYRDLRSGEEGLASLVWDYLTQKSASMPEGGGDIYARGELSTIPTNIQAIDLLSILQNALHVTRPLANQRLTSIQLISFPEKLIVHTDPTIAQQLIVSLMSYAIRQACQGSVIEIIYKPSAPSLVFRYVFSSQAVVRDTLSPAVLQLAGRLNWSLFQGEPSDLQTFTIEMNQKQKTILIVDDNEGVVELLRRYMTDMPLSVVSSSFSLEGLRLAGEFIPDLIILDVMMKEMDGWDFLRRIKSDPVTSKIQVVICSVFFEPDLAKSLGAAAFLVKPVTQASLFSILRELSIL